MAKTIERNEYLYRVIDQLHAENAKLRKLVKNMVLSHHMELCPVCPFNDECFDGSHKYECIAENRLEAQARKLGIEVDE